MNSCLKGAEKLVVPCRGVKRVNTNSKYYIPHCRISHASFRCQTFLPLKVLLRNALEA